MSTSGSKVHSLLAGRGVERIDPAEVARGVHHPVDHHRRGFLHPRGAEIVFPCEAQLADIVLGDVAQPREMAARPVAAGIVPIVARAIDRCVDRAAPRRHRRRRPAAPATQLRSACGSLGPQMLVLLEHASASVRGGRPVMRSTSSDTTFMKPSRIDWPKVTMPSLAQGIGPSGTMSDALRATPSEIEIGIHALVIDRLDHDRLAGHFGDQRHRIGQVPQLRPGHVIGLVAVPFLRQHAHRDRHAVVAADDRARGPCRHSRACGPASSAGIAIAVATASA